jgi:hypothetical protein
LNPDDKNYGKVCLLYYDNYCRSGYFILQNEKLLSVLKKLKHICNKINESKNNNTHPIQILMNKLGISCYFKNT